MSDKDKFEYSYSAPTEEERREIDGIRREYRPQPDGENKLEKLRALDGKVKNPAVAVSLSFGILGLLIFGLGMAMVLKWQLYFGGIAVSVLGCVPMALSYPIYSVILKRNKRKYGGEILALSEELLNGQSDKN